MKTLINKNFFIKSTAYADEHFYSKPYSITPIVKRWFNQFAMVEFENGTIIHLSGQRAEEFIDIVLDDQNISSDDLGLIKKFHLDSSNHEQEREELLKQIADITLQIQKLDSPFEKAQKEQRLENQNALLRKFDEDKIKANTLYSAVVARGTLSLNQKKLEQHFKSPIKHIVYRPNHDKSHGVRSACFIPSIYVFKKHYKRIQDLNEHDLETLQLMMLFSVVGRKDETGFNDNGSDTLGRTTYEQFRAISGKEYLNYCKTHAHHLYTDAIENIYRDAIITELMGYPTIEECIKRRTSPIETFIDYVIEKEHTLAKTITREEALTLITKRIYSLDLLFPPGPERQLGNTKLDMMNEAHSLDLSRCYPLFANKPNGPQSIVILNNLLNDTGFYDDSQSVNLVNLSSVFQLLRCSFDAMQVTGQSTTYGLISLECYEAEKVSLLHSLKAIEARFSGPFAPDARAQILSEAQQASPQIKSFWVLNSSSESMVIQSYKKFLLLKEVARQFTKAEKLKSQKEMFSFHHKDLAPPHKAAHKVNALALVQALESVSYMPGVLPDKPPTVLKVVHNKPGNLISLTFENQQDANLFVNMYTDVFDFNLSVNPSAMGITVTVNRQNYRQLVKNKALMFPKVVIPKSIDRELFLVSEDGLIDALHLISHSRGMGRLVSTSALKGENFPDYDYLFRALEDPVNVRYTSAIHEIENFPLNPGIYCDPRTGICYKREVITKPVPEVNFQEPITEPASFAEKLSEGLVKGIPGKPKNTIFTKKMAHSLLPPNGIMREFPGTLDVRSIYFPIGVLSNLSEMDLKDQRYIWSQNMITKSKFWSRDSSILNHNMLNMLNALFDKDRTPQRGRNHEIILDKNKLYKATTPNLLVEYLESRAKKILEKINFKLYKPSPQHVQDFRKLLQLEANEYREQMKKSHFACKKINQIYKALDEKLAKEAEKTNLKYALSIEELIKHQKANPGQSSWNEILAGNTKHAVRALYVHKDALFDRLNLAYHALQIKKNYGYDIPLLVLTGNNAPYFYSEALIRADLEEAYRALRSGQFPYDVSTCYVPVLNQNGTPAFINGMLHVKMGEDGKELIQIKNQEYQRELLVKLFKLGCPDISSLSEIEEGKFDEYFPKSFDLILQQMDVIGRFAREQQLMQKIVSFNDKHLQESFFLRCCALGHLGLIDSLMKHPGFMISVALLEKGIQFAEKNYQYSMKIALTQLRDIHSTKLQYLGLLVNNLSCAEDVEPQWRLKVHGDNLKAIVFIIDELMHLKNTNRSAAELEGLFKGKIKTLVLNSNSQNLRNESHLNNFMLLLVNNPELTAPYAKILAANQEIQLDKLIEAQSRFGIAALANAMTLMADKGWETGNNYLLLLELKDTEAAANYLNCQEMLERTDKVKNIALTLLDQIQDAAVGPSDISTYDYCVEMRKLIESEQSNYIFLRYNLEHIQKIHEAVTSPEMHAVKKQIARLEKNAQSFFGIGNRAKAEHIKSAVAQVSLMQRAHIFSNEANPMCNRVRIALASHRISRIIPFEGNKVESSKAANSFIEIEKEIKSLHKL